MNRGRAIVPKPIPLLLGLVVAWPSLGQAASCTISPQNPARNTGQSVTWSYSSTGFSGTPSRSWTFQGGNPSSSTSASRSVAYATAGTFSTTLRLSRNGTTANCSTTVTVAAPDTQAPTVPGNLTATAAGTSQIDLTWAASTDNVGVTGYRVERCTGASCTNFVQIATPASPGYSDTGRTAATTYRYRVRAADATGLLSGYSSIASAATAAAGVSINSTSQSSLGEVTAAVPQQSQVLNTSYSIVAINDLGMHCGDLDTRIASILPPFQVLLGQVIQKGGTPTLNPSGVSLHYSSVANPADPALADTAFDGLKGDGTTYKTNFWDTVTQGAYDPFYPAANPFTGAPLTPLAGPPFNVSADTGLPVPNVEDLYIGPDGLVDRPDVSSDGFLSAVLHAMPGSADPYAVNTPLRAQERYLDKPFFVNFPFGYVAQEVDWYEGAGVPFAAFDDFGRENAYPLVRVQAKNAAGTVLSTVDTVLPISGEASCTNCHSDPSDVQDSRTAAPTDALLDAGLPVATSLDDPDPDMPARVSVEYAADINVLRLHDLKHGPDYVSTSGAADPCAIGEANPNGSASCLTNKALVQGKPVVCQVCHYTPALDLAQLGPLAGPPGTLANGRNQLAHQSNSRVMHNHHGSLAGNLFPAIPAPIQDANGLVTNQAQRVRGTGGELLPVPSGQEYQVPARCHVQWRDAVLGLPRQHGAGGRRLLQERLPEQPGCLYPGQGLLYQPGHPARPLGQRAGLRLMPHRRCGEQSGEPLRGPGQYQRQLRQQGRPAAAPGVQDRGRQGYPHRTDQQALRGAGGPRVLQRIRQPGSGQSQAISGELGPRRHHVRGLSRGNPCGVAERQP